MNKENEKEENKSTNKIDRYSMMIISKYFNTINDYINIEKTCKEYQGIIEQFKYNPIPFKNQKERELFKNIETYHCYKEKEMIENIEKDPRIKHFIHWEEVNYSLWKESNQLKHEFKNIVYTSYTIEKKMFMQGWWTFRLSPITIDNSVTSVKLDLPHIVGSYSIHSLVIPSTVTSIVFNCSNKFYIRNLIIDKNNPIYYTSDNHSIDKKSELLDKPKTATIDTSQIQPPPPPPLLSSKK